MANLSEAMKAKSDQLNFVDIGESELMIEIESVHTVVDNGKLKVVVTYVGCNGRPYKPSLGMARVMRDAWGDESDDWVGHHVKLYGDPSVKFGPDTVGGIKIRSLTGIPEKGIDVFVAESKAKRRKQHFDLLKVELSDTDKQWIEAIKADATVVDQLEEGAYKDKIIRLAGV